MVYLCITPEVSPLELTMGEKMGEEGFFIERDGETYCDCHHAFSSLNLKFKIYFITIHNHGICKKKAVLQFALKTDILLITNKKTWACNELRQSRAMKSQVFKSNSLILKKPDLITGSPRIISSVYSQDDGNQSCNCRNPCKDTQEFSIAL